MLGITHLTERGDTLRGCCPICKDSDTRAFVVTPAKNTWYCFKERSGGDVIRLVAKHDKLDDRAAAERIAAHNGAGKSHDNPPAKQEAASQSAKSQAFDPLKYLETLDAEHEALADLGILPETLVHFKAGYASKGLNRGRLAVAWIGGDGKVQAFIGVALNGDLPKYLLPKGMPTPYWFNNHAMKGDEEVRILPDILDVMRAFEAGVENTICPLAPIRGDSLTCLKALVEGLGVAIEF